MDYNINAGAGTDVRAGSAAAGLLDHTRAYLAWLDRIFSRYPDLIIENCGSGGMRMEYSLLSRLSIQSVTDQTDYLRMAVIACNCMTAVTPEQAAIWSYPLADGGTEETIFNMVNAVLLRIHQNGYLANLSAESMQFVREGIAFHQRISSRLQKGLPFWPLGLASMSDDFCCAGVDCGDILYLAVWRRGEEGGNVTIPLRRALGKKVKARYAYPEGMPIPVAWESGQGALTVGMEGKTARVIEIRFL
jgi:alpha-galactosidase